MKVSFIFQGFWNLNIYHRRIFPSCDEYLCCKWKPLEVQIVLLFCILFISFLFYLIHLFYFLYKIVSRLIIPIYALWNLLWFANTFVLGYCVYFFFLCIVSFIIYWLRYTCIWLFISAIIPMVIMQDK